MLQVDMESMLPKDEELIKAISKYIDTHTEQIAEEIATEAKQRAPRRIGRLVRSIRVRPSRFEGGGWLVIASAPHAHLVEYGHQIVDRKGRVRGRVAPSPFLRPAAAVVTRKLRGRIGRKAWGME